MTTIEKVLKVLADNFGITFVFVLALIVFSYFSSDPISGIICAASALLMYASASLLYREYKRKYSKSKK